MPMNAGRLYDAISPVCPVLSTAVGDDNNRSTWTYEADPSATQPQKDAADDVIATIPIDGDGASFPQDFIASFTDDEYAAIGKKRIHDLNTDVVGYSKLWDQVVRQDIINMNKQETKDLKAALVSAGVLTQARADEIFSMGGVAKKTPMLSRIYG